MPMTGRPRDLRNASGGIDGIAPATGGTSVSRPYAPSARAADERAPIASCPRSVQLQQIMTRTDQGPLFAHRLATPAQELAEAPRMLDLAERRFHDRLAPGVQRAACLLYTSPSPRD